MNAWSRAADIAAPREPMPLPTLPPTVAPYAPWPRPRRQEDYEYDDEDEYDNENEYDDEGEYKEDKKSKKKKSKKSKKSKKKSKKDKTGTTTDHAAPSDGSWSRATATWYTSYPKCCHDKSADQTECRDNSGCRWEGYFKAFPNKQPKEWVEKTDIVAFYTSPNDKNRSEWDSKWKNKKLRIKNPKTGKTMEVTVYDTCDDGDCGGCCSRNADRNGGTLIDLEEHTARRFYDGKIEDLTAIEWQLV